MPYSHVIMKHSCDFDSVTDKPLEMWDSERERMRYDAQWSNAKLKSRK